MINRQDLELIRKYLYVYYMDTNRLLDIQKESFDRAQVDFVRDIIKRDIDRETKRITEMKRLIKVIETELDTGKIIE